MNLLEELMKLKDNNSIHRKREAEEMSARKEIEKSLYPEINEKVYNLNCPTLSG